MNNPGDVIFGVPHIAPGTDDEIAFRKCFTTIDSTDYDVITSVNLDHNRYVFGLAVDVYDTTLAVVENNYSDLVMNTDSIVRLWEIGGSRNYDDDGADESDEQEEDSLSYNSHDDHLFGHSDDDNDDDDDDDGDDDEDVHLDDFDGEDYSSDDDDMEMF